MGERRLARARSGFRRSRRFRGDRRGVVAVVGTLLALLVFFALFGVFLTQYVPLWMEENESALSSQIESSLSTLKSGIDDQYLIGGIPSYSVPFSLSSQSVPLLAQPTIATLSYLSGCPGGFYATNGTPKNVGSCDFVRLAFTTGAGGAGSKNIPYTQTTPTNYLEVQQADRYYVPVTYFFENDAVVQTQSSSHQGIVAPPPFNVTKGGGGVSFVSSILVFLGSAASYSGQGSKDVTSTLGSSTNISSTGRFLTPSGAPRSFNVTLTMGVHAVCAWYNLLYNDTFNALGPSSSNVWTLTGAGPSGALSLPPTSSVCQGAVTNTYELTLEVFGVSSAVAFIAQDQLTFNAGGL
jgi:hypothetical protein